MKIRSLMTFVFLLSIGCLNAQSDFKPGYVIFPDNDTIYGEIDSRGDKTMSEVCRFKPRKDEPAITYSTDEIAAYRFTEGKFYVSTMLDNGNRVFLEYLINGKLNIYYYRDNKGEDHYLIDKPGFPLKEIPFEEGVRRTPDGKDVLYKSTLHFGLLQYYTDDAADFLQEPFKIIKPDHRNLVDFAEKYHSKVCSAGEECIIYEKDVPFINASVEIFGGRTSFNRKAGDLVKAYDFGAHVYLWMPRVSERFFFKTGLLLSQVHNEIDKSTCVIIPIQIQYQYSHYKLMPSVFLGIYSYFRDVNYSSYTLVSGGGVDYRLSNKVSITSNLTAEFLPPFFKLADIAVPPQIPQSNRSEIFISYSIFLGLRFAL